MPITRSQTQFTRNIKTHKELYNLSEEEYRNEKIDSEKIILALMAKNEEFYKMNINSENNATLYIKTFVNLSTRLHFLIRREYVLDFYRKAYENNLFKVVNNFEFNQTNYRKLTTFCDQTGNQEFLELRDKLFSVNVAPCYIIAN